MMKHFSRRLGWIGSLPLTVIVVCQPTTAQVVRDSTLSTQVNSIGNVFEITDGNRVGSNLFHSFRTFSIPTGSEAYFNNPAGISNIFGRVTGSNPSVIDGLIRANGNANLTLINPNGITFGADAQLDIGGSFLGSTADSLKFEDGTEFSATSPLSNPLLTVSAPIGLQLGTSPGPIEVQGNGHQLTAQLQIFSPFTRGDVAGLKVKSGETLALVGGEVNVRGGTLGADSGRIEVGSVVDGQVNLRPSSQGWILGYDGVQNFQDITFRSKALAVTSGQGGGSIHLQGRNVNLLNGSIVLIQTQGSQDSLGLSVDASESLTVQGTVPDGTLSGGLFTETISTGSSGDIQVSAQNVVVQNGAAIFTGTFSEASGGTITVNAADFVHILGFSRANPSRFSNISATTFGSGSAGTIEINTDYLLARNGGNVASVTGGIGGTGAGGNVLINARDSVDLLGVTPGVLTPSQITAGTGGAGDAGSVTVNTQRLTLRNGGRVDASTLASGDAGSVTINASESVEVRGQVIGSLNPSLINSSANIVDPVLRALLQLPEAPSGAAGDLTLRTHRLTIADGGEVTVRNDGTGNAGTLEIQSNDIFLQNQGRLSASTLSGQGGNIILKTESLQATQASSVSAAAGGSGSGGNISLISSDSAGSIVLLDSSNITANALLGTGGNVQIETSGLFPCATCTITASSQLGVDGVINIVSPETDSTREGLNLLEQIIDPDAIVVQACSSNQGLASSELTITGRGGLPARPNTPLTSDALISFDQPARVEKSNVSLSSEQPEPSMPALPPPAQGLSVTPQGTVLLTTQPNPLIASHTPVANPDCQS